MQILQIIWFLGSTLVISATLLSWLPWKYWWMRIWDFPRMQVLLVGGGLLLLGVLCAFYGMIDSLPWMIVLVLLCMSVMLQCKWVLKLTGFAPVEVQSGTDDGTDTIRIIASNVDYTNTDRVAALDSLIALEPDLIALIEADHEWEALIDSLREEYPFQIHDLQGNGKGIALLSKLPIVESEIRYIVSDDRPSIWVQIQNPHPSMDSLSETDEQKTIGVCVLHPPPPGLMKRNKDERVSSAPRDREIILAAQSITESPIKHWVMFGDFNDVGWSQTTERAKTLGDLRDPRIGRGMYSTYPAKYPLARYPIDHVLVTQCFRVTELACLDDIGSDHLPLLAELQLDAN